MPTWLESCPPCWIWWNYLEKNLYFLTGSCSWRLLAVSKGNWWQRECCAKNVLVFTCSLCENRHSPLKLNLSLSAAGFKRFLLFTFKGNGICFWFVPHFSVSQRKASYSQSVCRQAGVFDDGCRWQKTDRNLIVTKKITTRFLPTGWGIHIFYH